MNAVIVARNFLSRPTKEGTRHYIAEKSHLNVQFVKGTLIFFVTSNNDLKQSFIELFIF